MKKQMTTMLILRSFQLLDPGTKMPVIKETTLEKKIK